MVIASKKRARRQNTIALPVHTDHPNSPNSDQCKLKAARAMARAEDVRNIARHEASAMNDRLSPRLARRDLLCILAAGAAAATASAAPLAAAAAETGNPAKKSRARYQANSPEVQTFYRVNRYPAK
jgi:hypothetical protein